VETAVGGEEFWGKERRSRRGSEGERAGGCDSESGGL